jgi:uncharacterized membrane protein YedE/YeeE
VEWGSVADWISVGLSLLALLGLVLVEWERLRKWTLVRFIKLTIEIAIAGAIVGVAIFAIRQEFVNAIILGLVVGATMVFLNKIIKGIRRRKRLEELSRQLAASERGKLEKAIEKLSLTPTTVTDEDIENFA